MSPAARVLRLAFAFPVLALADPPAPSDLFPGPGFAGWEFVTQPAMDIAAVCRRGPDGVIAAPGKPIGYLETLSSYRDFTLHAEWRWPDRPGNGGILVHISTGPKDRAWPVCFQVQTKFQSVGDLLPMAGATFAEPLTSPPGAATRIRAHTAPDSEHPAGEWNSCDVTCRGDTIEVRINGVLQNRVTGVQPAAGRVGFQFEGAPFELRAVRLVRLD